MDAIEDFDANRRSDFSIPDLLHHYTDLTGLTGIIESQKIWATDIRHLNDTTEIRYSRQMLSRLGIVLRANSDPEWAMEVVCGAAAAMADSPPGLATFVASFCHDGDNLSQWRGYGAQGRGFAIGLNRRALSGIALAQGFSTVPILYDQAGQEVHLDGALRDAIVWLRQWSSDPANATTPEETLLLLGVALTFMTLAIKNPYFEDEREWRLVHLIVPGVWESRSKVRLSDGVEVPYEEIELLNEATGDSAIAEVVIGPITQGVDLESEVRKLLDRSGLDGVAIRRSLVPLRDGIGE